MRLFEIVGNDEPYVYNKLRYIYFILNSLNGSSLLPDVILLRNTVIHELNEDLINLSYWILTSERINKLYKEITQLL